jgi:pimeloyl-ACP methyl ester carboxylesterase
VSIAYQVVGDGPFDLVFAPPFVTHVELWWELAAFGPVLEGLASFSRLILFDKRGTGMSDRVSGAPTLEQRMDDLRAVLDAAGSIRTAIFAASEGAAMALLFAAMHPERVAALVLRSAFARMMWAPDYPWGRTEDEYRADTQQQLALFGPIDQAREAASHMGVFSPDEVAAMAEYWRRAGSPGAVEALAAMNKQIDVRHVLGSIQAPTLLLHGAEDELLPIGAANYLADNIPGAQLVVVAGAGHLAVRSSGAQIDQELRRFLSDVWTSGGWEEPEPDRILATVVFTDIAGSTQHAVELGDRAWRELLAQHHALIRRQLARYRGREQDTAGDGFLASFDGPARAIRFAHSVVPAIHDLGLDIRVGIHTGECELIDGKLAGVAVHTGARIADLADPGEVLVSSTVRDLVAGSDTHFEDHGRHELKGLGHWQLFQATMPGN